MYKAVKRALDAVLSGILLVLFSPILSVIWLIVLVTLGWPPIFTQTRPGYQGIPFRMRKFRTMTQGRDASGRLLPDDARLTPMGRFLRRTSLDELPELVNVFVGDMSLVGPRPLLMEYLERYSSEQARRHEVRPGITGLAQVSGRNALTWEEKFRLDVYYVDHMSFWTDVRILLTTAVKVLKREGISASGYATMPPFRGISHHQH